MWDKICKLIRDILGMSEPFIEDEKDKEKVRKLNEALDILDTDGDGIPDILDADPIDPAIQ